MVKNYSLVFPGQGVQGIGMARDLYGKYPQAARTLDYACEILGTDLKKIMFDGPENELNRISLTQLAVFVSNMMVYDVIKDALPEKPMFTAGHSLGEYCALSSSGALSFEDALKLVAARGRIMEENCPEGAMAAVIGMRTMDVSGLCKSISESGNLVEAVNFNSRKQTVISGTPDGIEAFKAQAAGKGRIIPLKTAGPFHSFLMRKAQEIFTREIDKVYFSDPAFPLVSNATAKGSAKSSEVIAALKTQIASPVQWVASVEYMAGRGTEMFVECAEKSVLSSMIKNIAPDTQALSAMILIGE
ncbi:MAG: [acyl-carrier-protein] S-malonyltransferase [Elusimicrobia bacterium CG03_land_8_20_14_0_80_50_18]|nr:MAG: [acyl-carrier-protein] S-malonyltransferase [Elusimicrobia bacterium CG03_land_8_20_14_0_80_50_18]PIX14811.1 MAG: [acyl-carrier-protein] S-malonyltransferase [Elusimicrobia bacterium CG_4_8_14_3_um_filter_50_9]